MPNTRHKIEAEELLDGGKGKLDKESLGEEVFCEGSGGEIIVFGTLYLSP